MADTSYVRGRDVQRMNAHGEAVTWADFAGHFVWAEYAAPWCGVCPGQATEMQRVQAPDVTKVTVVTSGMGGYGDPPTQATAAEWAGRFGLDPGHVIAANLTALSVPRHYFFSPEGHSLHFHAGFLSAADIQTIIAQRMDGYQRWKQTGEKAEWMR